MTEGASIAYAGDEGPWTVRDFEALGPKEQEEGIVPRYMPEPDPETMRISARHRRRRETIRAEEVYVETLADRAFAAFPALAFPLAAFGLLVLIFAVREGAWGYVIPAGLTTLGFSILGTGALLIRRMMKNPRWWVLG